MANAIISELTGTQTANFGVGVSFPDGAVSGLEKTDFNLRALTGNGTTGVDFSISGTEPTANWTLMFTLPSNAQGSFEIAITGMVTPSGGSSPEAVMSNAVIIHYDTTTNLTATFGTVEYRDGGEIAVPVTFGEAVSVSKTVFRVTHVSGDDLTGIEYVILGKNTAYELVFTVPPDRAGRFRIEANGAVLKVATGVWDNIIAIPLPVVYNTAVPEVVDWDIPENYTPGEKFYVRVALNTPTTGWHLNNTYSEIWIEEGARLGQPTPYKWIGANPPDIHAPVPDPLPSDWQQLASPPGGHQGPWHGEEGQYFLIEWTVDANATGTFNLTLRPDNPLRGPVS